MFSITGKNSYELQNKGGSWLINGNPFEGQIISRGNGQFVVMHNNKSYRASLISKSDSGKEFTISVNGSLHTLQVKDEMDILMEKMGMNSSSKKVNEELKAPMPGLILSLQVGEGDKVEGGQKLCVLEAMKMENNLKAEHELVVDKILVNEGDSVEKNQVIMNFKAIE